MKSSLVKAVKKLQEDRDDSALVELGYYRIGQGNQRWAYAKGRFVIKIDKHNCLSFGNEKEWENWQRIRGSPLEHVFLNPFGRLEEVGAIIYPRVTQIDRLGRRMRRAFNDFEARVMTDLHEDNLGRYKRRVVIIDYGNRIDPENCRWLNPDTKYLLRIR